MTPKQLRAMQKRLEAMNPKINAMIDALEKEFGDADTDETVSHLCSVAGLLLEAAYECELKAQEKETA